MVTANNYIFRPVTGHHQVVHPMKRVEDFSLDVKPDDGLLEVETCSC